MTRTRAVIIAVVVVIALAVIGGSRAEPTGSAALPTEAPSPPPPVASTATLEPTATITPSPAPVTVTGSGRGNSRPFDLEAGDYLLRWQVAGSSCGNVILSLEATDGSYVNGGAMANEIIPPDRTTGESYLYGLVTGRYYVAALSGCSWTVTITPLG